MSSLFKLVLSEYDEREENNTPDTIRILIATWVAVLFLALCSILVSKFIGFELPIERVLFTVGVVLIMQITSFVILLLRTDGTYLLFMLLQYISMFSFGCFFILLFIYSMNMLSFPFIDEYLINVDLWMGFDWRDYIKFISQYPTLQKILNAAYISMAMSLAVVVFSLVFTKNCVHLQRFAVSLFTALVITAFLGGFFPALAGYIHYDFDIDSATIRPIAGRIHEEFVMGLRFGKLHSIPEVNIGTITFPSFHASAGLLLIWGFHPVTSMRLFMAALNVLLIIATPFSGGHYLIDIIGGLLIAMAAILFSHCIIPTKQEKSCS